MAYPPNLLNGLRVVKGQSKSFQITITKKSGAKAKLSSSARLVFSAGRGDTVFFSKNSDPGGGIEITDRENGKAILTLEVADIDTLNTGSNDYDLWVDHGGTPPRREPAVDKAELFATESVTSFSSQ
jgi:hypothetical protein